ncbi:hypothetical protein KY285_013212 [Solanum tuberosum]|nr:hypothetical protein KY285_013212 [Solanum tuberosum]
MAPKVKNVAGSKRSRKGEAFGSSSGWEPVQKFGKKTVERYGWDWFSCQQEAKYMGDEFVNKDKPPYRDIRHTLCGVDSIARWERSKDTGRHNTLHFANFNQVALVWLKIVCTVLLPAKHLTEVTRDRVVLVYMLMNGMPINVGSILRQNMMKFQNNMRWRFYYGGLITRFLWGEGIDEEAVDMTVAYHPDLTERQARDDNVMARMFDMVELQLRIGGRPVTDAEMETMAERYPLSESATFLCKTGPAFVEPLDDDKPTADKAMDDEEEAVDAADEVNALMVFDGGDDEV